MQAQVRLGVKAEKVGMHMGMENLSVSGVTTEVLVGHNHTERTQMKCLFRRSLNVKAV